MTLKKQGVKVKVKTGFRVGINGEVLCTSYKF